MHSTVYIILYLEIYLTWYFIFQAVKSYSLYIIKFTN